MKIVLHIGVHKTGTTAIQHTLHRNSAVLSKHGFFYGTVETGHFNHHVLAIGLRKDSEAKSWAIAALRDQLDHAEEAGCQTCIFSSEMFVEGTDARLVRDLLAGHELQVIAYLRRPDELVASAFNEMVRNSKFRWPRGLNDRPFPYDPSYQDVLSPWLAVFDPGELVLAPFDPRQWPNGDLMLDFLDMIGAPNGMDLDRTLTDAEMNISLSDGLVEVLRLANAIVPMDQVTHSRFVHGLYALQSQYPPLYPDSVIMMNADARQECYRALAAALPKYRPYFRAGFEDDFLRWSTIGRRIAKTLFGNPSAG